MITALFPQPGSETMDQHEASIPEPDDSPRQSVERGSRRFGIGLRILAIVIVACFLVLAFWLTPKLVWHFQRARGLDKDLKAEELVDKAIEGAEHPIDPTIVFARESLDRFRELVVDFEATMVKQEQVNGELFPRATMFTRIRNPREREGDSRVPLSVYIRFDEPSDQKGREVIWVDGENDGKIVAHEAGLLGFTTVRLEPAGPIAMAGSRYPITEMGIERLLVKMVARGMWDRQFENCEVDFKRDVQLGQVRGVRVVITHPERSEDHDFYRAEIELDADKFSYLRYAAYDWPAEKGQPAPLLEEYIYKDVTLNPGLTASDFDPQNPEYNYP
jgi:hypothetical protein